jgi:hypothetical protein
MICFLTGNPFLEDGSGLNPANGFVDALLGSLPAGPLRGPAELRKKGLSLPRARGARFLP